MQTRHGGVLVAEPILRPYRTLAAIAVDGIYKAVAAGFVAGGALDVRIGEETWWHARPEGEDYEGDLGTGRHCAAAGFVKARSSGSGVVGVSGKMAVIKGLRGCR